MLITHTTATSLKQNTATIINQVFYQKTPVIIERHGKPLVKIVPLSEGLTEKQDMKKTLDKYFGSIPDLAVPKRTFRKKNLKFD